MPLVGKRLTLRGFIVTDHEDLRPRSWLRGPGSPRRIACRETVVDGIDRGRGLPLFRGGNTGKMLVRL